MNKLISAAGVLLMTTSVGHAAGLDRSGQSVSAIFKSGTYGELSFGQVTPSVTGVGPNAIPPTDVAPTGNVAPAYNQIGFGFKTDVNDQLSFGMIMDQPFGASVDYSTAGYALTGVNANVESSGLTVLARYKLNDAFSIHAGVRQVTVSGDVFTLVPAWGAYSATFGEDSGTGYVIGAAYEKPEIALRLAVTYSSAIDVSMPTTDVRVIPGAPPTVVPFAPSDTDVTLPQSVNVDFQTGIAANTLLMASIRWVDWTETVIAPTNYPGGNLLDYDNDGMTYSIGVGRRFSDKLSASVTYGWENASGGLASNLSPTDGYKSLQVGAAYTLTDGVELSGGVRYVVIGDATTELTSASFTDNSAVGVGMKLSFNF